MFKLESYITPILLSYVDKYIKNFKPEDSQLSLWGGEVSLHNLDLRLEVLEDELQLPFTFVSGHIHELIIHVPWTKLYSEPICITINTIECILKLRGEESTGADGGGNGSGRRERRRRPNKGSDAVAPPGYVQTMVNKIVSNITINCCNLIVKYVEEDIVMSMNVKNLIFQSASDKWEPEFSDFLSSQLMLRKIIKLSDVTICLDKRNASGKIDSYQEPVLYRCSLTMRLLRCYNSASALRANVTRLDIHCHKMTFNISEVQVPMMMRLILLARALQNREVGQNTTDSDGHADVDEGDEGTHENLEQDSWTGWAWNLVPAVLPGWSQDWTGDETGDNGLTVHSGIYIDDLAFNLRVGDVVSNENKNAWKNKVELFLTLSLRGCFLDYTCHDNVWVNSQLGISSIQLEPAGSCSCGVNELFSDKNTPYFESGSYQDNYLSESLFSCYAVENCGERRKYNLSWDTHQNVFSESSLLEKTPALAIDYLYMVELTERCNLERFLELNGDLEYSDLPEHALCRTVMGPFVLHVNSGLLHRMEKVRQAAALYDYQPYSSPPPEDHRELLPAVTTEEYDSLEENIPLRTYQYTVFQPRFEFHWADHPKVHGVSKRKISTHQQDSAVRVKGPILSLECQCMDVRFISPMYPRRLVRSACLLPSLPQHMFHACHSHAIGRILGLTSLLSLSPQSQYQIFSVDNLLYKHKELFFPHLWEGYDRLHEDCVVEAENVTLTSTKAQILLIHQVLSSLMDKEDSDRRMPSSLINDAFTSEGRMLEVIWNNINWQKGLTMLTRCDSLTVAGITAALVVAHIDGSEKVKTSIFSSCLEQQNQQSTSHTPFLKACIQWPQHSSRQSHAPLLVINVQEGIFNLDPMFYAWLLYTPTSSCSTGSTFTTSRSVGCATEINVQSGRSGHRKISDVSVGFVPSERSRRSQTPLSVHSSEKDRETVIPPLVTQLSGISLDQALINTKSTPVSEAWQLSKWLVQWFPVWQGLVVSIDVAHWQVHLPTSSFTKLEASVPEATDTVDRVCIHLPVVQICSATSPHRNSQLLFPLPSNLPVHLPPSIWTEGSSNFPWNISLSDLSVWTLSNGRYQYLLKPVTTKCTVGISTRFANGDKECITSLGLCIHNDTGALHVTLNQAQADLLSNVLLSVTVAAQTLYVQHCAVAIPAAPGAPSSPTTISESASVSEPKNTVKNAISEPTLVSGEPVKLSVWLQWTLARMSVNLYQECNGTNIVKKRIKLNLEVEDLMAAFDLQQVYSKVKLKVAGANIRHYARSEDGKAWQLSPYQGLVMCGYEETSASSSGQIPTDDGCGLLTATLTRAKCHNVHTRWGASMSSSISSKRYTEVKVPSHSNPPEACFITEILVKLQPLDFLLCTETLTQWSAVLRPFTILFEEINTGSSHCTKTSSLQPLGLPHLSSASLPLLYLDLQAVRILMPLNRSDSFHDTFIIQLDSVTLAPHAENPLWRTPIRPDVFHMAEQARILSVPGSEVEDRQYELNILGFSISTGQWHDMERCRRLSAASPASSLRTMSENPALVWNSLGSNTQSDASEIVGSPKPNLMPVLAPLKICIVGAPAIVYRSKVLVCGHALEINAVSDIDVRLTTNQMQLAVDLMSEVQTVLHNFMSNSTGSKPIISSFILELAQRQYHRRLTTAEPTGPEQTHLDSGIDTADISSVETPHSSRMRGVRRVSRSPRYLESVHGPSVHSAPSSQSWCIKQEHDEDNSISKQTTELLSGSRATIQGERASLSPELLPPRDRQIDSPFDFLVTAGKISLMLYEDTCLHSGVVGDCSENSHVQRPLLYILVTQPHMFYSYFSRSCTVQVSMYNTLVKLGSLVSTADYQPTMSESDFPLTLFESCKGETDPQTGVPPALCTVQWTFTPTKPAQVSFDFGRPAKFVLSTINLEHIQQILKATSNSFGHASNIVSSPVEPNQPKKRLEQVLETLSGISALHFKAVQVVIAFHAEDKEHIDSVMEVSVSSLIGNLMCTSRTRWGCNVSSVERIVSHLTFKGLSLVSSHRLARQPLLEPCDMEFRLELLWPAWLPRSLLSSLPHSQLTIQSEYIALSISPDHVRSIKNVYKAFLQLIESQDDENQVGFISPQHMLTSTPASEAYSSETDFVDSEQHYTDDLRAGAFQFMDATNTLERDQLPLPYQCVFWESSPPAIAWRYPQPRSLTNVHIFPVPFQSSPDAEVGKEDAPVVVCSLQYWSECRGAYQHYTTFLLSETNESKVDLPSTPGSAVSAVWRVLLAGTQDIHGLSLPESQYNESLTTEVPVVSPRALAACMRIDSFFSACLAPNLQACFNITSIQVSIMNQLADWQVHSMPSNLRDFSIDGKVLCDHSFLWWSFNHFALFYSAWPEGHKTFELNSLSRLDILDYTTLSQQNVIDPFLSRSCISVSADGCTDVSVVSRPIACRLGPSVTHTLAVSFRLWQQELESGNRKPVQVFTTQYILCNDTVLPLLVGQANTDEQILLSSRQCHLYSWRSTSQQPVLHMSVIDPSLIQLGKQVWSTPFPVDCLGTNICKICLAPDKIIIVFVKVHDLTSTQKQVTLSGQLQILNQVNQMLDLRIMRPSSDWSVEACSYAVPLQSNSIAPSLFLDRHADDPQLAVRLRLREVDANLWTGDIPLRENPKSNQPWLVKVPLQEKHQFICIWCRVIRKSVGGHRRILIMLSPMYAIRSLLPTSSSAIITDDQVEDNRVSLNLKGQGDIALLHVPGALKESTHQLHLRTFTNMKIFPFGYSYADQKQMFQSLDQANIESIVESSSQIKDSLWPLPIDEDSSIKWVGVEIANSYVQASYKPLSPYSGTMLLELRPWALLLNMLECDVCIEQSDSIILCLPSRGVAAPPKLEGTFHLGLKSHGEDKWSFSDAMQLARADWGKSFYMPRITGLIPIEGHVQISVKRGQTVISLLTLSSQVHNEVRVVKVCSSFIVSNSSSIPLQVTALAVRHSDMNCRLTIPMANSLEAIDATIDVLPDSKHRGYPLEKWLHLKSCEADIVPFISINMKGACNLNCPLPISGYPPRRRFALPFDLKVGDDTKHRTSDYRSLVLCVAENNGQTFVNIADEPHPQAIIHNCCDIRILCVEVSLLGKVNSSELKIIQDTAPWDWYCSVDPNSHLAYSMPSADNLFPQIPTAPPNLFVSLAVEHGTTPSVLWSSPIQLNGKPEQFISLPGHGDVKVHTWMEGHTTHLSIEAVSRVEICARDIRSRLLAAPEYPVMPEELNEGLFSDIVGCSSEDLQSTHFQEEEGKRKSLYKHYEKHSSVKLTVFVQSCTWTLTAPVSLTEEIEVSVLTLDHIAVSTCPIIPNSTHPCPPEISVHITLGDFQLDNQLFERGGFDFPVVLMGQQEKDDNRQRLSVPVSLSASASQLVDKFSPQALLAINITLETQTSGMLPKSVHISLGPITAYVEDKYVMELRKHISALLSPILASWIHSNDPEFLESNSAHTAWIPAPLPVCLELQVLRRPVCLTSLTLDPIWLLLSVHSCMRLYIALDRSPLQFTQFCRRSVFTTSYNLGHSLSMHYLSGAIFGAGWVVGSLELLGSPGGFARTLGTGLRDFLSLPYHGILQGPWGFLVGVTHGSASLMKHFTAGTLTSVTKMASSVARNLDRLTLDAEHLERTEELRRVRPQGVAEGLLQGLTGLGISLLGAVGGLAHHPLQSLLSGQATPKEVVTGVGRGLVGVFTKPLSGAADLVAMTGQGLLQGAGWSNLPKPRQQSRAERGKSQGSALIKYSSKIQRSSTPQCLLVLEATLESSASRFQAVTLILTAESLVILSADGDTVESQLPLGDLVLPDCDGDPTMLTISFKGAPPMVDQRMWDFVNGCRYVVNTGPPTLETSEDIRPASPPPLSSTLPLSMQTVEHQSAPEVDDVNPNLNLSRSSSDDGEVSLSAVQPAETTASSTAKPPIVFHVNPQIRNHFLVLLKVAQRQILGQGFQIL